MKVLPRDASLFVPGTITVRHRNPPFSQARSPSALRPASPSSSWPRSERPFLAHSRSAPVLPRAASAGSSGHARSYTSPRHGPGGVDGSPRDQIAAQQQHRERQWKREAEKREARLCKQMLQQERKHRFEALQLRRLHEHELGEALRRTRHAREEGRRALADAEANVVRFFEGERNMEPHERGIAARALLVAPSRALKNLMHEAELLEGGAKAVQSELVSEGARLRDAGNEGMLEMNLQLDASVGCLANELVLAETDATFSISALMETVDKERREHAATVDSLQRGLGAAQKEGAMLREALDAAEAKIALREEELRKLHALHVQTEIDHEADIERMRAEHHEHVAALQRDHAAAIAREQKRVADVEAQRQLAEEEGAATRVGMAMRLRTLAKEKSRGEELAARQQDVLRAEQLALQREMEAAGDDARQQMAKLEEEKLDEKAQMTLKLDKLKRLQEQALGGVTSRVERKARSRSERSAKGGGGGGGGSSPASLGRARPRQLLYWEVLKSKLEQSPQKVQKALVSEAIERERSILHSLGEAIEKERVETGAG